MSLPGLPASPLQCLKVTRFLFRQHHHGVGFTWGHPSLVVTGSFLIKYSCKNGSLSLGWNRWHQFSVCLPSPLHVSNSHPGIIIRILFLSVLPQATWNAAKHLVLLFWATIWRAHGPLSTAGCCQFLGQPSCSGAANKTVTFFFLWAFILSQCYMWDFTGIKKSMNVVRFLHIEQQCF